MIARIPPYGPNPIPMRCPVCTSELAIRRLECRRCGTGIDGDFQLGWVRRLSSEQLGFLKVFVEARGKIKDMEAALGISYPTVVARLDELARATTSEDPATESAPARGPGTDSSERLKILDELSQGTIDTADAVRRLRKL